VNTVWYGVSAVVSIEAYIKLTASNVQQPFKSVFMCKMIVPNFAASSTVALKELQTTRDLVDNALWPRANTQYRRASTCDLSPSSVMDDLCAEAEADCLRL
jgi:hypothetical protein